MPITYTPILALSQIPVGTDGATANNERNSDMAKIDALFAANDFAVGTVLFGGTSGEITNDPTFFSWDKTNHRLGIGNDAPASALHISKANSTTPQIRLTDTTNNSEVSILGFANVLSFNLTPVSVPATLSVHFFRYQTNTAGISQIIVWDGQNSASPVVNASIGGFGATTYFCLTNGSMGVGTNSVDASALLEVDSTTQGFLPPRATTTQINAISSPSAGLIMYDSTTNKLKVRTNSAWVDLH